MIYNEKGALASIQVLFQRIIKVSSVWNLDEKTCETTVVQKLHMLGLFSAILGKNWLPKWSNISNGAYLRIIWGLPCENVDFSGQKFIK